MLRRRTEVTEGEVAIPVTPMLDMTFQLLIFFIVTFNPSRIVEGFFPAEVSEESAAPIPVPPGGGKGGGVFAAPDKEKTWLLHIRFDENHACEGFPLGLLNGPMDDPEDHPRPIAAEEIAALKSESERTLARDQAQKDKASFVLTVSSDTPRTVGAAAPRER